METFVQKEWHGIDRRNQFGPADEFTSQMEINTEPGGGALKRLGSRTKYLDNPLPHPALKFNNIYGCLQLIEEGNTTFSFFDDHSGGAYEFAMCFRLRNAKEYLNQFSELMLFKNGKFQILLQSGSDWLNFSIQQNDTTDINQDFCDTTFSEDKWYWLSITTENGTDFNAYVYEDGSASAAYSDTGLLLQSGGDVYTNSGGPAYIGTHNPKNYPCAVSVAYCAVKWNDSSATPTITAWQPELFEDTDDGYHFLPRDVNKTIFPAKIGDSTDKASWVYHPRPGIEYTDTVTGEEQTNVKGIKCNRGKSHTVDLSGEDVFNQRTVFMFNFEREDTATCHATLLRSRDSMFALYIAGDYLSVRYLPDSLDDELSKGGYNVYSYDIDKSANEIDLNTWLALEIYPNTYLEEEGNPVVNLYEWDDTNDTWDSLDWSLTVWYGSGIKSPSSTTWELGKTLGRNFNIYDFRVIIGDDDWTTDYLPDTALTEIPSELVCWLNHDDNGYWPRDENCQTLTVENDDYTDKIIALADRVTGHFRFRLSEFTKDFQWDGCEYLDVGYYSSPQDVKSNVDGDVYGPTDGPWYDNSNGSPLVSTQHYARKRCSTVGKHKYVTGASPIQRANIPNKTLGFPNLFATVSDLGEGTSAFKGELTWDTQYKFKITLYDNATGNESNPHGPFYFDTSDYSLPGASSEIYCRFSLTLYLEASTDVSHYQAKFYRYHDGTGTYRYEGTSGIEPWTSTSSYSEGIFCTSEFTFSISNATLALRTAVSETNDNPPLHTYSTLWNGRAWYVQAENPSRINFSKLYYFGQVPGSYVCWTDEGVTGDILGLIPGFGGLLLLKENSIWIVPAADGAEGFMAQLLIPDIGVVSADAAVFVDGNLWFADQSGIYVFDGQKLNRISDNLDGLERNVWDSNARKTVAFYDKQNWKVVFTCEGTAITFNSKTGAASFCGVADHCIGFVSSSGYSGPVYGTDGMIWKEYKGQIGFVSDTDYSSEGGPATTQKQGRGDTSDLTDVSEHWTDDGDGTNTGSVKIGYNKLVLGSANTDFCTYSSGIVGHPFSQWTKSSISVTRDYDISCNIVNVTPDINNILFKTRPQTSLTEYFISRIPLFYKGQYLYYGIDQNDKIVELLTCLYGDWVRGYLYNHSTETLGYDEAYIESNLVCPYATLSFTAETLGENYTSNEVTTGEDGFAENRYLMRMPVQRRGFRGYFELETDSVEDFPPVKSIFVHFKRLRMRAGGHR